MHATLIRARGIESPSWRDLEIPVDYGPPLKLMGFSVDYEQMDLVRLENRAGELDFENHHVTLADNLRPEVIRFTGAHELGHALYHRDSGCTVFRGDNGETRLHRDRPLRGDERMGSRPATEREADCFAGAFLMPWDRMRRDFAVRFAQHGKLTLFIGNAGEDFRYFLANGAGVLVAEVERIVGRRDLFGFARLFAQANRFDGEGFVSLADTYMVSREAVAVELRETGLVRF